MCRRVGVEGTSRSVSVSVFHVSSDAYLAWLRSMKTGEAQKKCFLITLDKLRLMHKTPTSTPNVTFPQLRRDDAPHLPHSSRKSTSRFKKVGIFFCCCLLENGLGNLAETLCFATLTAGVVRKVSAMNTLQELIEPSNCCLCWTHIWKATKTRPKQE